MSTEENKALVRRFFEDAWGKGNVAAARLPSLSGMIAWRTSSRRVSGARTMTAKSEHEAT